MNDDRQAIAIRAIAGGGDGVGTLPDGRTIFVPRAAVGDVLHVREVRLHARFARAEIAEVVSPSVDRVEPPCPHYLADRCGSCQLMHLNAGAQRAAKSRIAGDAMRRLGKLDVSDPDMLAAPAQFGYRSKVTFTWSGGRLGYHPLNEARRVFDVRECLIAEPAIRQLHAALRTATRHLPSTDARVMLRRDHDGGLHVSVAVTGGDVWTGGKTLHAALQERGVEAVVWFHPEGGTPRAVAGAADPWPATVFEQVNPAMGALVRVAAVDALGRVHGEHLWDLYAGIGETTALLVAGGATVESIEGDRRAVEVAIARGPAGPVRHAAQVEAALGKLAPPEAIVTNPPRTGMTPAVVDAIAASGARRVAYVSCDPATLARDIGRLAGEYRLASLRGFDQFPQTAHLESLALLERR